MKRKVLLIVENLPMPFDPRVWKEACALRDAGYQVSVLSPSSSSYPRSYELLEGVHIYRHPMPGEARSARGYLWEYGCALFWEVLFTWWIFLTRGFHVIQGCNPPDNIFLVALPFRLFGVKYIFDHHDVNPELYFAKYERTDMFYRALVLFERWTFHASDVVMSTNESYREIAMRRGGVPAADVFVVRNGPDLSRFRPVAPVPALRYGKRFLVGYVGTMSIQEGLDILLEVARNIRARGRSDVHFTCVGGGPGLADLRRMAHDMELEDMFNFTGRIPDKDLLDVLSTADVCVNPDKPCEMNDLSTMIKISEYMALGKPIVQFDLKEGRYTAGEASLYADNNNQVPDFADKILWLLDHPEESRRMGRSGFQRVQDHLAWEYSVKQLLAAYDRAFEKRGVRHAIAHSEVPP